jgi:hypothetical protein
MTRKMGQIIAVREDAWMIRIPMGCDPQTRQLSLCTAFNDREFTNTGQANNFTSIYPNFPQG